MTKTSAGNFFEDFRIGQMIARLEGEAVLKAAASRLSELTLDGVPTRKLNNNLRSLKTLPLRVKAV